MTAKSTRLLSSVALFIAVSVTLGSAPPQTPGPSRHIVLISLDGFPGWALDDPYLPVPTIRRLAARGAVAKGMRPVNPTVTWPNHTTLITGVTPAKHGVLFNGLLKRDPGVPPRVEPWLPRDEMVRGKTLYDIAHARGMTTAQVDWVAILAAPTVTWEFPERPAADGKIAQELVQGRRPLANRARDVRHPQHHLARSHLDAGGGAHHPSSTSRT